MGLIDFVKSAGTRFLGDDDAPAEGDVLGARIAADIERLGFSIDGLAVAVEGDRAVLTGTAATARDRRKAVLIAGNTLGIASVDDRLGLAESAGGGAPAAAAEAAAPATTGEAAEADPTYYTVVAGDSLSKIAKELLGDAMRYPEIFEANRPMLEDPDKIYPGQKLFIPKA